MVGVADKWFSAEVGSFIRHRGVTDFHVFGLIRIIVAMYRDAPTRGRRYPEIIYNNPDESNSVHLFSDQSPIELGNRDYIEQDKN
jgi:hypothetical protein